MLQDELSLTDSVKIEIFTEGAIKLPYNGINKKFLQTSLVKIAENLKIKNRIITLILTDNKYIQSINKLYRNIDTPTDVISFDYNDDPFPEIDLEVENLGDIYISMEKAEEQSESYKVEFPVEVKRLLVHGVLHLLGYDHEISKKEEERMKSLENKILEKL